MPEFRKDPIVGRWVIVAESRAQRPHDFETAPRRTERGECPFCAGNEHVTPNELCALRPGGGPADSPGWRIRVVPNKFPAVELAGTFDPRQNGAYQSLAGIGAHEVIVEAPEHLLSLTELSVPRVAEILRVYRDRLATHQRDPRLKYGLLFKNVGAAAGASLEHIHSQLIATPVVPVVVSEEMTGGLEFAHAHGRCAWCQMIDDELAAGARVVVDTPHWLAFCPFASRFALETWIVPKTHLSHYEQMADTDLAGCAATLHEVLARLETAVALPGYNYILHTAPFDTPELPHFHWHLEIMPSLTRTAGYEWGSGVYINPLPPERAAALLRAAPVASVH